MGIKLTADFPNMAKGTELDIGGVLVKNGSSAELDDDQEHSFVARHRKSVKDWAEGSEYVKVSGTPKFGPKQVEEMFPEPAPPEVPEQPVAEEAPEGSNS